MTATEKQDVLRLVERLKKSKEQTRQFLRDHRNQIAVLEQEMKRTKRELEFWEKRLKWETENV